MADSKAADVNSGAVKLLGVEVPALRWQTENELCLMVSGGRNIPGQPIVLWDCSASTRFSFPATGDGLIRWVKHSERCIDVAGGVTENGNKLQLWDCSTQLNSMQWTMPEGEGLGPIRMKAHPSKCINVEEDAENGAALVLWDCEEHGEHGAGHSSNTSRAPLMWRLKQDATPKLTIEKAHKDQTHCHTAAQGEPCWAEVQWAKTIGITTHADWYPGLSKNSSLEEFQAVVYKHNATKCPLPCNPVDASQKSEEEEEAEDAGSEEVAKVKEHEKSANDKASVGRRKSASSSLRHSVHVASEDEGGCHTAQEGDECHDNVLWAMQTGIFTNPEWYVGLTKDSSFEEFQVVLHETVSKAKCPKPCECHTATPGEDCHDSVVWIFERGLDLHPDWYEGLTKDSTYYEAQMRLHKDENPICQRPCHPPLFRGSPSLFCWSVFVAAGYEPDMLRMQLKGRMGIFGCDEFAVVADEAVTLGDGPFGPVKSLVEPKVLVRKGNVEKMEKVKVGVSKDNTAANALLFMEAWALIKYDFRYRNHDWVIKADPDAVVFPDRLRNHLAPVTGKNVYVKNCDKWGGPGWPKLFGSLEVFSISAIETYMNGADKCKSALQWQAWGEDLFMEACMNYLGVGSTYDVNLVGDTVCKMPVADCTTGKAAYHAFKSQASWMQCYHAATPGPAAPAMQQK